MVSDGVCDSGTDLVVVPGTGGNIRSSICEHAEKSATE